MNTDKYKKLLEEEKIRLESELSSVAERNPSKEGDGQDDWIPTPPADIGHEADPIDQADEIEEYDDRIGIEKPLEEQLHSWRHPPPNRNGTSRSQPLCRHLYRAHERLANPPAPEVGPLRERSDLLCHA